MIISANTLKINYSDLESLFNTALQREIDEWNKEKDAFFKNPFDSKFAYMPNSCFQIWLDLDKSTCPEDLTDQLKIEITSAGWDILKFKWQSDERTGSDQLYINIEKIC